MPFQFQIQPQNTALQTLQVVEAMEGQRERRDLQRQSLQLRMQEAASKMDERQKARVKEGLEGMARVAGAARNAQEWDAGIQQLVAQGFKEFEGELGKWSPDRASFNLRRAQDTKTLFENSPEQRAAKVQFEADKYNATIPGRMQVAQAGKTTVSVGAPSISMPVPKIDPVTGKFLGYEAPAAPETMPAARGKAGAQPKADPNGLGTVANNKLEEAQLDNVEAGARANDIAETWDPKFLELGTRFAAAKTAVGEKTGLWTPSDADKQLLAKFTTFKQNALNNLNRTIKELTGSAMGVEEAQRIIATLPNPGSGLWDGDSPTEFKAKLDNAQKQIANARIRLGYARRMGMNWSETGIALEDAPKIYNARHADVMKEIQMANPAWKPEQIRQAADRQTAREFGLARR